MWMDNLKFWPQYIANIEGTFLQNAEWEGTISKAKNGIYFEIVLITKNNNRDNSPKVEYDATMLKPSW